MIVRGDIIFTKEATKFTIFEDSYLLIDEAGKIEGIVQEIETGREYTDHRGKLIIPSFVDLHLHANQFANCGLGNDEELLGWLEKYTFKEEVKFKDLDYAGEIYKQVLNRLWEAGSLRSVIYASLYTKTTSLLFDLALESGLSSYIGKVNMDRNVPEYYSETTEESLAGTREIIERYGQISQLIKPIITPRFVPHCTSESMAGQGKLSIEYNVPVQSHINESKKEIEWVKSLHPEALNYSSVYDEYDLFGEKAPALMAHCIHNTKEEIELMKKRQVYPVHCPESNANLSSGIMAVKKMLEEGLPVSLGSDISGGHHLYLPYQMVLAIQLSKMKGRLEDDMSHVIGLPEAIYMATKSGGSFFGKTGSFETGYSADFLVINTDSLMNIKEERSIKEKLEKFIYIGSAANIEARYLEGKLLEKPFKE